MVIQKKISINSVKELIILSILSFIMPFSALFTSLLFYKKSWSRYLFVFFCTYFGYTFIIPSSKLLDSPFDSEWYANVLTNYYNSQITFSSFVNGLFTIETSQTDLYQPFLTWIVSRFTSDYHVLFAIFGLIFGWFYSKILWFVLLRVEYKITLYPLSLLLMVMLINPLWNINGVRMWTGMEVYLYGILLYLYASKNYGLILMIVSVLFHFSFIIPVSFFFIYQILPKHNVRVVFIIYIISLLITNIPLDILFSSANYFPDFIANRIISYTNYERVIQVKEEYTNTSTFIKVALFSIKILSFIFIYYFFSNYKKFNKSNLKIFVFILYTFIWTNLFSIVPSGGRFLTFSYLFIFIFLLLNLNTFTADCRPLKFRYLSMIFMFSYYIYAFRTGMEYQGLPLIFENFAISNMIFEPTPFINFFK